MFLWAILFLVVATASKNEICNKNTLYACPCNRCWSQNYPIPSGNSWVTINFERCNNFSSFNEAEIRSSLANWMNEECAFVLRCPQPAVKWDHSNVIIGDFQCNDQENVLRLLAIKEPNGEINSTHVVHWNIMYSIIESREHLLSTLLYSDLSIVSITTKPEGDIQVTDEPIPSPSSLLWLRYFMAAFTISFLGTILVLCFITSVCLNYRLNWKRLADGKWISTPKQYRKSKTTGNGIEENHEEHQMIELRSR